MDEQATAHRSGRSPTLGMQPSALLEPLLMHDQRRYAIQEYEQTNHQELNKQVGLVRHRIIPSHQNLFATNQCLQVNS